MENNEPNSGKANLNQYEEKSFALNGKITLIAIVVLFVVVILMICLHEYARWSLIRARRRLYLRRNGHDRRPQLVFYVNPAARTTVAVASRGLDASVISSLPVFAYSSKTQSEPVECAVCLSEFGEGETGRVLPQCGHTFHIDCIDMWFHSHSTCPLCRAPVELAPAGENGPEVVVTVSEPGSSSGSGSCAECHRGGEEQNRTGQASSSCSSSSSLIGFRDKPSSLIGASVNIEMSRTSESFGDEAGCDSLSTTQSSFRSPMSRMLSFKRKLTRDRKASVSPPSGCVMGCNSMAELELEADRGRGDETQTQCAHDRIGEGDSEG